MTSYTPGSMALDDNKESTIGFDSSWNSEDRTNWLCDYVSLLAEVSVAVYQMYSKYFVSIQHGYVKHTASFLSGYGARNFLRMLLAVSRGIQSAENLPLSQPWETPAGFEVSVVETPQGLKFSPAFRSMSTDTDKMQWLAQTHTKKLGLPVYTGIHGDTYVISIPTVQEYLWRFDSVDEVSSALFLVEGLVEWMDGKDVRDWDKEEHGDD